MLTKDLFPREKKETVAKTTKMLIINTVQYFEIEVPIDADPYDYIDTEECRKICANSLLSQRTSLMLERVEEGE